MSLGSKINEIRKQKNLSIDELCVRSGIPKGTLSKITAGITTSPTLDTVRAIANALGCRLDDLDDNPNKKDYLSAKEQDHIIKYRSLDPYGKEAVDGILDVEYRRCMEKLQETSAPKIDIAAEVASYETELRLQEQVGDESSVSDGQSGIGKTKLA